MRVIAVILIFLFIGGYMIYQANNLDYKDQEDRRVFLVEFGMWFKNLFTNTKEVTSHAIDQDWLPTNKTKD